ncbi:glycosyltransferase family 4 protein [Litorisediminicola beolgyonensis]|uniref:Glycosyltransferase family 4 protein n=1 Tax=Litorisediminicola beolgyonensis TaxID=1173614 RepID=A0ABW3ZJ38_9RHOB
MRRLLVNGRFLAAPQSAVNQVAQSLTCALAEAGPTRGWNVVLAVPADLAGPARALGLRLRVAGQGTGALWDQRVLPGLRREGVVAGFFNTVPLTGRGYITLLHDAHVFTTPASYPAPVRLWRQVLARRAGAPGNLLLTVSEHARARIAAAGIAPAERIGVVPNGPGPVATSRAAPDALVRLGLSDRPYCVAQASRLPHKNLDLILRAFSDPRLKGVDLVLTGGPSAGRDGAVLRTGFLDLPDLAALYDGALAVCVPSREEGFGLPALEAMARGTVPLVAKAGALPEVVGPAGRVLPVDDPSAWVEAILALRNAPELRAALVETGRRRAADFSWSRSAEACLDLLDGWVVSPRRSGRLSGRLGRLGALPGV